MIFYDDKEVVTIKRVPNKLTLIPHVTDRVNKILDKLGSQYVVYGVELSDYPRKITITVGCHGCAPDEDDMGIDYQSWCNEVEPLKEIYGAPVKVPSWYWSK